MKLNPNADHDYNLVSMAYKKYKLTGSPNDQKQLLRFLRDFKRQIIKQTGTIILTEKQMKSTQQHPHQDEQPQG